MAAQPVVRALLGLVLGVAAGGAALADQIIVSPGTLNGDSRINAVYRFAAPAVGEGTLDIEWTDVYGRVVEQRNIPFELSGSQEVAFPLDLTRAIAMRNELRVHLFFDGVEEGGARKVRETDERVIFTVRPRDNRWWDYHIIMWQSQTPEQYAALQQIGVDAGQVLPASRGEPDRLAMGQIEPLLRTDLRWYVENIATDFYSAYHRWFLDRPVNWRFLAVKKLYEENPLDTAALSRDPSLSDPKWLAAVSDRLIRTVRANAPYRPLFYDLGDEPGIGDLSIFWDFDFSQSSLKGMREWLKQQYRSLSALNREWGSHFADWESITPTSTREAIALTDDNFSAWADFKEWMDVAFARALRLGTDAVHSADDSAYAAIEGAQIPGWGGYDYTRLAHVVDVMELYDGGGNLEVVRSLNPKMIVLTTSSASGSAEGHYVWRELLRGSGGVILWDPRSEFAREDGTLGKRGRAAAPYFRALREGLGALLINSDRVYDPVAILYSPASIRTQWMLDWKPKGQTWAARDVEVSYEDKSSVRSSMLRYAHLLERAGIHPRFLSADQIEAGALGRDHYRISILPHAISLGSQEADAIRRFVELGG